jgi:hypothetical protein
MSSTISFASSALAAVPELDETNWIEWYRRIQPALISKNYLYRRIIDGDYSAPIRAADEASAVFALKLEKWEELQIGGTSLIQGKLGSIAERFVETKGIKDNIKLLLETLKERFRPKGSAAFDRLAGELLALRLDDCKDIADYNARFNQIDSELTLMHTSARLPDCWLARLYMNNLNSAYDTFRSHWVQSNDYISEEGKTSSLDSIMQAAKKEEQRLHTESGTALMSHGKVMNHDQGTAKCNYCQKLYHAEENCVLKHPHLKAALDRRLQKKRADRDKKRGTLKAATTLAESSTRITSALAIPMSIKGCATRYSEADRYAFPLDK